MATEDDDLIGPNETAYRLELTPAQLKMTHTALKSLLDDFGHDEHEVKRVVLDGPGEAAGRERHPVDRPRARDLAPQNPSANFASSLIRSGVQAGVKTMCVSTASTPSTSATNSFICSVT